MATQVTNYQCPSCLGPLHYSSVTGKLQCEYCEKSFDVAEIESLYSEKNKNAEDSFSKEEEKTEQSNEKIHIEKEKIKTTDSSWDSSTIAADWGEDAKNMRSYTCPSCGAELICEEQTAASSCPYCGNQTIVPGQFSGDIKPNYIIPFKFDKKAAEEKLRQHYKGKLFLPKTFSTENTIKKICGIYVPFWLFNAKTDGECHYEATTSITHREKDYLVTRTKHYNVIRSGNVDFCNIPTDASAKMPDDLMDSLEPYNYSELKPFLLSYLPGYVADKYDVEIKESSSRADKRCINSTDELFRKSVTGYESVVELQKNININRGNVNYALLPVWILKTKWENKDYIFAMNGQTGKFVGNLPVSKKRFWGFCGILTAILTFLILFVVFWESVKGGFSGFLNS